MSEFEKVEHPLANLFPSKFQSFDEWLARWNSTKVLGEKLGLLHCLQVTEYWLDKREQTAFFLLDVADGHRTGKPFHYNWREHDAKNTNKNREIISRKAFDVLCVKLFTAGKEGYPPLWWWMLSNQESFDKLLWFCRPEADNYDRPYKGEEVRHQTEVFGEFLQDFARLGWAYDGSLYQYRHDENPEEIRARLVAARPQFIEILCYLRQLWWLNQPMSGFSTDFPELDRACLAKLKGIALGTDLPLPEQDINASSDCIRRPKTLHEAICGGSVAAEILVLHSIRQREQKRIAGLFEASRRRWQEAERQQKLRLVAKQQDALAKRATELTR